VGKELVLLLGPFNTRSGYGDHARDIFHSIYDMDRYDIKVFDVRWGDTPRNALDENNLKDKRIIDCLLNTPDLERQPDIYIDIRIPNEFETHGKFNIGITAGVETNAVSQKWIEGCNKMDLVIVPSEHSKSGFMDTVYDKVANLTNGQTQKVGELKLEKPIEVLFEGIDVDIYKKITIDQIDDKFFNFINNKIKEKSAFLFIGQWIKGGYGEDRKDIGRTIKIFYETFSNQKNQPALILKTSGAGFSILDREDILNKINQIKSQFPSNLSLPNIYLLHGDLSPVELNYLYNHPKVKALISFTHGEGFGRPILEATMTGLPVIASNWSGHLDFLDGDYSILVGGEMGTIPDSVVWEDILIPQSKWFTVNEKQASDVLSYSNKNFYDMGVRAKKLMDINNNKFSHSKMTEKFREILDNYVTISKPAKLNLPKLTKVKNSSNSPNINLPKLKLPKLEKSNQGA
tara:strand:+ start:2170 stop:3549 length:1380 start_codon:yes stop_codon:yes gene_type:complete